MVLVDQTFAPLSHEAVRRNADAPSRRYPCLVRQPHRQRPHRGHQLPRAGSKGKGRGLKNLVAINYLVAVKLDLTLPTGNSREPYKNVRGAHKYSTLVTVTGAIGSCSRRVRVSNGVDLNG